MPCLRLLDRDDRLVGAVQCFLTDADAETGGNDALRIAVDAKASEDRSGPPGQRGQRLLDDLQLPAVNQLRLGRRTVVGLIGGGPALLAPQPSRRAVGLLCSAATFL